MSSDDLNFADLDAVEAAFRSAGILSCSRDVSEVRAPGVWLRFDGLDIGTLTDLQIRTTVHVVVPTSTTRAREESALAALFNIAKAVVTDYGGPAGPITPVGLRLPGSQTLLPCLQIPLNLQTTN